MHNQPVILWASPVDIVMVSQPFCAIEKSDLKGSVSTAVDHNPIIFRTTHFPNGEIGIGGRFIDPPSYSHCVNILNKCSTYSVGTIDLQQTRMRVVNGNTPESKGLRWRFTNEGCPSHRTIRLSLDIADICHILKVYKCPSFEIGHLIVPDLSPQVSSVI